MNNIRIFFAEMKNFLALWLGQSVSSLGTTMTGFAISIWAFEQTGSALVLSVSALLVMLPKMITGILVSPFIDRNDKKRIMIYADIGTGLCTIILFLLLRFAALEIWHIFSINVITSVFGSFQNLASDVAISAVVPKNHFIRANSLQSLSSGITQVVAPALSAVLLGFMGIIGIIIIDIITMTFACVSLAVFVKIPMSYLKYKPKFNVKNYLNDLQSGFKTVCASALLFRLMFFMAILNFITSMASYGLLTPMILAKSGNNEVALAVANSAIGIGNMVGAFFVFLVPTQTKKIRMIFLCYFLSVTFADVLFSLGNSLAFWAVALFIGYTFVPVITANTTYFWRTIIPIEKQSRAFAVRYAIQSATIPIGVLVGGVLADFVFEPFMEQPPYLLGRIFGEGEGAGTAVMFFISGILCAVLCIVFMFNRTMQKAEREAEIALPQ